MLTSILKWLFVTYNKRNLSKKFYNNDLNLDGLKDKIEIYRDKWGISHIYAD